jgi:hypothetical protein
LEDLPLLPVEKTQAMENAVGCVIAIVEKERTKPLPQVI